MQHDDYAETYDDYHDDHIDDDVAIDDSVANVSSWGVSIVLHAVVLLLMFFIVFYSMPKNDQAFVAVKAIPPTEDRDEPKDDIEDVKVTIESEVQVDNPQKHELEIEITDPQTEDEVQADLPVKGRTEADAAMEMGGPGAFMAIGAGGGGAGMFGNRNAGGIKYGLGKYGGSKAALDAVDRALNWFRIHQSPNGQWDVDGYPLNCREGAVKCEPGTYKTNIEGDVACTGYALLCFLGRGYDHRSANRYQHNVRRAIDWLLATQQANGLLGVRNYEHPVATMALAEAYAMTNDPKLRDPVQKAVNIILERQAKGAVTTAQSGSSIGDYGLGWNYTTASMTRQDSSVSGWNVMALKAAKAGGIDIGDGMKGADAWVTGAWEAANKAVGIDVNGLDPYGVSQFPYTWNGTSNAVKMHNGDLTCVGALCVVFLDRKQGDVQLETMANWCYQNQTPTAWPTDTYYMYYNTLSMFMVGGERWQKWNGQVRDMLVNAQRKDDGCFAGSWDPQGAGGHHISEVGRLLVTAYCTLSLEVYYRFKAVNDGRKKVHNAKF